MKTDQSLHDGIYNRLVRSLGQHPQSWLAKEAGVPESTISTQMVRKRFTLDVLVKCADALEVDIGWLIRGGLEGEIGPDQALEVVAELDRTLSAAKATRSRRTTR